MTYGTPVGDPVGSQWSVSVQDTAGSNPGSLPRAFLVWGGGDQDLGELEALAQKIITALNDHTDLEVTGAGRIYPTSQDITP
jgi:hypothetical protein